MNIKDTLGKIIIWGNVVIAVIIYIVSANTKGGVILGFLCTSLQMGILLGLALLVSVIHLATKKSHPTLGKAMKTFWASAALVLGISFPACLMLEYINPIRW